jgi:hypothetical protein
MNGMLGSELIQKARSFLKNNNVSDIFMPQFAFKADTFWEMPAEEIEAIFKLGFKPEDVIEKLEQP